jgi:ankyrin repeat protein
MPDRHLPVRPSLDHLRHQAKDLLRAVKRGEAGSVAEFRRNHPDAPDVSAVGLADAQLALARSYGLPSWPRLVLACRMTDAICRDDLATVRRLVLRHPSLLHEDARGVTGNWGPPMSYAANLGRDRIIEMLYQTGASDVQFAFERACLQSRIETARLLYRMGARPVDGSVMGPCETLSVSGLELQLELGARLCDERGDPLAPMGMVLETYGRNPKGKHDCLDFFERNGIALPDTAPMAVHRGRIDLLERLIERDPGLLNATFAHAEMFPPSLGCHADPVFALGGTPVTGGTLLHLCVEYDELDVAQWLIDRGADVNAKAAVTQDGFGGHTSLFNCVVAQPPWQVRETETFARLLLDHGADPNTRASLRKRLMGADDETEHEYRDVTPLSWGERFHDRTFVCRPAMRLIAQRGGWGEGL